MIEFQLGRKRILDTQYAALLHAKGVRRLLTNTPTISVSSTRLKSLPSEHRIFAASQRKQRNHVLDESV